MEKDYKRSSEILLGITRDERFKGDLTFDYIMLALGERAFGLALLFFALPSALPVSAIPGVAAIFGLPIAIFAFQMIFARETLWLPKRIAERPVSHENIAKIIHTAVPYLKKLEYFLKPRWAFMTSRLMEIVNGSVIFCVALLLMLPIPFSNFIFAFIIIMFSLGFIEKDGVFIVIGYIGVIVYVGLMSFIIMEAIGRILT